MFAKHRIEALSDGLFAIAMTLLVLDIKVPTDIPPGGLHLALAQDTHQWISFAITFALASIFWVLQHRVFEAIGGLCRETLIPTFVFLAFVSVLPFSTAVFSHHMREPLAMLLYFGNQSLIALALVVKLEIARARGHFLRSLQAEMLRFRLYGIAFALTVAAVSVTLMPLNWVWLPLVVVAVLSRRLRGVFRDRLLRRYPDLAANASVPLPTG